MNLSRLAAPAVVALLTAACSGSAPTPAADKTAEPAGSPAAVTPAVVEPVTITYFTFSAAPDHLDDLDAIIAAFNQDYPHVTVDVETASYDQYFTKLQTQVIGGDAPDTFELNYENFVGYASAGALLDLTPLAAADGTFDAATFYPRAYEVFQAEGRQYGLPETFANVVLYYNKGLFDAAGVAYPTADWTWEDERAAAEALTDPANGVWGNHQGIHFFEFYKALAQNGGSFFSADKTQATFNDALGVEAATWLTGKVGTTMPDNAFGPDEDTALFKAGKLAMWHNGIWQFAGLQEVPFAWDIAVEPGNVQKASHFFSNAVVASATTEHPEEAWAWTKFLTSSPEAVAVRLEASWELPAVADESLFATYLEQTPPDNREAVFESLDAIVVPPVIEQQSKMQDIVSQALEKARLGQMSVQEALDAAAAEVNELLK